jgi:carbon-monoxide dehydrogenase catalytic subunit
MVAGGAAAHSDHGRDIAHTLLMAAENPDSDYQIKDEEKLKEIAEIYEIETQGREIREIALDVAHATLTEFGQQEGSIRMLKAAPPARRKLWEANGFTPRAIDREIVEIMHRTHIGVDTDYKNITRQSVRASLSDGWGGSMIATELSDVLFSTPTPIRAVSNLGVINKDYVNLIVHGHEPTLSDIVAAVSMKEDIIDKARKREQRG